MSNGTEPSLPLEITEQLGAISRQKVGYARVSSKDRNLDRQIEQLKAEKVFTYYTDKASGGSRGRLGEILSKRGQTYSKDSTPIAKLMLGLLGSVAEFERSIIRERQAEGIARAKERGVYKGRARALTDEQILQARVWVDAGVPKAEVVRRLKVGRTTLSSFLDGAGGKSAHA